MSFLNSTAIAGFMAAERCSVKENVDQTPRNNSERVILRVLEIFSMLTSERFLSPRSIPPT